MCGLFGMASNELVSFERDIVWDLMYLSAFRGQDSTGLFDLVLKPIKKQTHVKLVKHNVHPFHFGVNQWMDMEEQRWKKSAPSIIAGHTRAATIGKVTSKNAHPFLFTNIVGMHNGTIGSDFENKDKFETDSEGLLFNIDKFGIETALDMIKNHWSAAYALVWYNYKEGKLFFLRNKDRPLCYLHEGGRIIWASDSNMLRYYFKQHRSLPGNPNLKEFPEDTLFSVDMNKPLEMKEEKVNLPKRVTSIYSSDYYGMAGGWNQNWRKGVKPAPERDLDDIEMYQGSLVWSQHYTEYDDVFQKYYSEFQVKKIKALREEIAEAEAKKKEADKSDKATDVPFTIIPSESKSLNVIELTESFGNKGLKCTKAAYLEKIKCGCTFCSNPVISIMPLFWLDEKNFLCPKCQDDALDADTEISKLRIVHGNGMMDKLFKFVEEKWDGIAKQFEDAKEYMN